MHNNILTISQRKNDTKVDTLKQMKQIAVSMGKTSKQAG
jgi:hypothetical protein